MYTVDISDYNSTVFNATFNAGDTTTLFKIPVYSDDMVEYNEMFDIVLSLPPSRIEVGDNSSAEGIIIDSTGKNNVYTLYIPCKMISLAHIQNTISYYLAKLILSLYCFFCSNCFNHTKPCQFNYFI